MRNEDPTAKPPDNYTSTTNSFLDEARQRMTGDVAVL